MPDLTGLVGQKIDALTIEADAASVYAYARALGETNPAYPQSADDVGGKVAPPAFAAVYALGAGSLSLLSAGIEPSRLIHSGQEFSWERLIIVGETLTVEGRVADVYSLRSLQFVSAEVIVRDAAGAQVCRSVGTILVLPDPADKPA
jgi:hypothetical protein